jgi:hypothetical protein
MTDKQFARQVAREMHRQRRRRRMLLWLLLLAIVAAAAMYLRCGTGWGIGGWGFGQGDGEGEGSKRIIDTEPKTCSVRISKAGITVDGKKMTREETVAACKKTAGAHVKVIGDTLQGDWEALKVALQEGGVTIRSIEQPRAPGSGSAAGSN